QAEQRQAGRRHGPLPQLLAGQPVALDRQGVPLEIEPGVQHLAFLRRQRRLDPLYLHDGESCPPAAAVASGLPPAARRVGWVQHDYWPGERRTRMIARIWRGAVRADDAAAYASYVQETGIAAYRETPGNRGAWVLWRVAGEHAEIITLSFWESR